MYKITSYYFLDNKSENTILYLHGWGCSLSYMMPMIKDIKAWNALVLDLPGFGKNGEFLSAKTYEQIADYIYVFIKENNFNINYIVGHSFGGKLAVYLANKLKINHLFLLSASTYNKKRYPSYYIKVYLYKFIKYLFPNSKLLSFFGSKDYKSLNSIMKKTMSNVINYDVTSLLKTLNTPTTLIYANKDKITPMYIAKKSKKKIKDSNIISINGDHFAYLSNINYINKIIESVVKYND